MENETLASKTGAVNRRELVRRSGAGLLLGSLGLLGPTACAGATAQARASSDQFVDRVKSDGSAEPLVNRVVRSLPELQIQPRPASSPAVEDRAELARMLQEEIGRIPVEELAESVFPLVVRYPAWLVAGVSLELFELVLEKSRLPDFELHGVAMEHVLPYYALTDQALIPLCRLLRSPSTSFSAEIEATATEQIEQLRGRLRLLGDRSLMAVAQTIRNVLSRGDEPTMLRVFVNVSDVDKKPMLQATLEENRPHSGDVLWRFETTSEEWTTIVRKNVRAIDKVAGGALIGRLFLRRWS